MPSTFESHKQRRADRRALNSRTAVNGQHTGVVPPRPVGLMLRGRVDAQRCREAAPQPPGEPVDGWRRKGEEAEKAGSGFDPLSTATPPAPAPVRRTSPTLGLKACQHTRQPAVCYNVRRREPRPSLRWICLARGMDRRMNLRRDPSTSLKIGRVRRIALSVKNNDKRVDEKRQRLNEG